MRLFQFHAFYKPYLDWFDGAHPEFRECSYNQRLNRLLDHRFMAAHILQPVYDKNPEVRFTVGNDAHLQWQWARENGFKAGNLNEILLAQIEEHRAEVIYSLEPVIYNSSFLRMLPGCVKHRICWHASPLFGADLSLYDLRVCNFPPYLEDWKRNNIRGSWFSPSHDPSMLPFADNKDRPIDIAFVGFYSRLHRRRNALLEAIARLQGKYRIDFRLMCPRWKSLAEVRILHRIKLPIPYLPRALRKVSQPGVYGVDMYDVFGRSKIVFNASVDMAKGHRINMRCFESLGCGACMVSDAGIYPDGFEPGHQFAVYDDQDRACALIEELLADSQRRLAMAERGRRLIENKYSKQWQWKAFQDLVAAL